MVDIVNAAPMVFDLGTNDLSTRVVAESPLELPQHLPKFYLFANKGPIGPTYVDMRNVTLTELYGNDTFDVTKKYYNHSTVFLQKVTAQANNCVVHRLAPVDAKDVANLTMYLDVLPTTVPVYQKNSDGSIKLNGSGLPTPEVDGQGDPVIVAGFKVKWVTDHTVNTIGSYQRGLNIIRPGTQTTEGANPVQSQQYPIFEFSASYAGERGNKLGFRFWPAMETDLVPFPTLIFNDAKNYPYYFQSIELADESIGKVNILFSNAAAKEARVVLEKDKRDPGTGVINYFTKVIGDHYINYTSSYNTNDLGSAYVYNINLTTVLTLLYNTEKVITDPYRDANITTTASNIYSVNIASFASSNGSPYQSIKIVDDVDSIRLTKNTNIFLAGANDGVMTIALFDALVANDVENYEDSSHNYMDLVMNPESLIYDTGFSLTTKLLLPKFISKRKDTFVVLSTFAHNSPNSTLYDQYSIGVALKTMLELYPESSTFGTPVTRGMIVGGSGKLLNTTYANRVPVSIEVAMKAARYMGAANGRWKNGFSFDSAPGSVITNLYDIDVTWVPGSVRNTMWSVGVNFVLNYSKRNQFFPAMKTVYNNDTSVLNSFFTAMAIAFLNKVAHAAWREFTGTISLTNAQLEERVNEYVSNIVKDRFDSKFVIVPACTVTELDNQRGFSWTLPIRIYSNNMKSVLTTYVSSYRISDLA